MLKKKKKEIDEVDRLKFELMLLKGKRDHALMNNLKPDKEKLDRIKSIEAFLSLGALKGIKRE